MATTGPGPDDVDEQTLQLGPELGSGGQGRVLRVEGQGPPLVFKQYKMPGADQDALKVLVDLPATLQPSERDLLHARTAWPLARVFDRGQVKGFLMQEIPGRFFGANVAGTMKLRELQHLVYPRKPAWGEIVPEAGVSTKARVEIASEFAKLLALLHGKSLIVGDVSTANVLWTGNDEEAAAIFLIDCDGIRKLGSRPVLRQADTLDWDDPLQPAHTDPDLDTDRYKLALFVGRVLTIGKDLRPGDKLQLVPDVPERVSSRVASLWQRAAGRRGTRPDAMEWTLALSNRDEIALPPLPPVRQRPVLPHKPLDGDPSAARPVIRLTPRGGGNSAPKASSA
jgi:DNA-binding helix-hairpin-helix protein with protein kinase domain